MSEFMHANFEMKKRWPEDSFQCSIFKTEHISLSVNAQSSFVFYTATQEKCRINKIQNTHAEPCKIAHSCHKPPLGLYHSNLPTPPQKKVPLTYFATLPHVAHIQSVLTLLDPYHIRHTNPSHRPLMPPAV